MLPPRQAEALLGLAQPELRTQCLVSRAAGLVMQMSVLFPTNSPSPQSAWRSPETLVRQPHPLPRESAAGQGAHPFFLRVTCGPIAGFINENLATHTRGLGDHSEAWTWMSQPGLPRFCPRGLKFSG